MKHLRWTTLALITFAACASSTSPPPRTPAPPARGPVATRDATSDAATKGIALYEQGRYAEAETVLAGASGTRARAYLAASRVKLKKYREAEAPAEEALAANPADAVASAALGESLVRQGRLDEAVPRLTAVLQVNAALPYAHYWRGQAYQRKGQIARMVADYQAFLELAPDAREAPAVRVLLGGLK
jgi:tetratricopeptide (TPR) repeat protein